jgi:hypothetical protein
MKKKKNLRTFFISSSDLRAQLEIAIEKVISTIRSVNKIPEHIEDDQENTSSITTSDNEEHEEVRIISFDCLTFILFRKVMIQMRLFYLFDKILHRHFVHYLNMAFTKY